jgi:alpha-beta hydrolase superfamily lysophospholipase
MTPSEGITAAQGCQVDIELTGARGTPLRGRWWRRPAPRGVLIVAHGWGEHGGSYWRVAEAISPRLEFDVVAVDFRGHGRSPGRRGVVRRYDDLIEDLNHVVEWVARRVPDLKRFVLAHSNGGQVALRLALENRGGLAAIVVSNPALRMIAAVPPIKLAVARVLALTAPWLTLSGDLRMEFLSRDPVIQQEHRTDSLRHSRMSAPLFFGMIGGGETLIERAGEIRTPLLLLLGGQDPIIDPSASRTFFERLGSADKTLLIYPKMLHEPLNEIGREKVVEDVARWLEQRA